MEVIAINNLLFLDVHDLNKVILVIIFVSYNQMLTLDMLNFRRVDGYESF